MKKTYISHQPFATSVSVSYADTEGNTYRQAYLTKDVESADFDELIKNQLGDLNADFPNEYETILKEQL